MDKHLKIGIAGCGIGGLTAGALLVDQGHDVTIYDQFAAPVPVGSGLVVQPVGQDVLRAVGVHDKAIQMGAKIQEMNGHEVARGRRVLNVTYGDDYGLAIHRASLFGILYEAALKSGCQIVPNSCVQSTDVTDGRTLTFADGRTEGAFDLVIDALGARSALSNINRKSLRYGAIWGTVDWPDSTILPKDQLSQSYRKAANMVGVLPIGLMPNDPTPKAAIFWSLRQNDYEAWRATPLDDWKVEAIALWPEFAPFLSQITSHDDLTMARYGHGTLSENIGDRLVHIGDAAHCASPQLGQGANMAMLDAHALAQSIARWPVQHALPRYARARRQHVRVYQFMSWALTPMYQSDSYIMPWLRDWILAPLATTPPFTWILTKVGAGNIVKPIRGLNPLPRSFAKSD